MSRTAADGDTTAAPPEGSAAAAGPSVGRKAAAGALWLTAATVAQQAMVWIGTMAVAPYLGPDEYGLSTMAQVVVALATVFVTFGFAPAIATGRIGGATGVATAHWLTFGGGVLLSAAIAAGSPLAGAYFANSDVPPIVAVAALSVVAGTWEVAPQAALQAAARFDVVAYVTAGAQLLATASTIVLAVLGAGVWAIILPLVAAAFARAAAFTLLSPTRLWTRPRLAEVRPHLAEFRHVTGVAMTDYLFFNADRLIVGRWLGQAPVGRFNWSATLVNKSMSVFTKTLGQPLLVSLGQLRTDMERFDRGVVRAVQALLRMTTPLAVGGAILAREFVLVLFSANWASAIELVRLFFLLSAVQAAGQLTGSVWMALGHARLTFWYGLVVNGLMLGVCALGVLAGSPDAVVAGYIAYTLLALFAFTVPLTRRVCGIPLRGLGRGLLSVVRDAAGMAIAVYGVRAGLILAGAPDWLVLAASIGVGAVVYLAMFRALSRPELEQLLAILPGRMAAPLRRLLAVRAA